MKAGAFPRFGEKRKCSRSVQAGQASRSDRPRARRQRRARSKPRPSDPPKAGSGRAHKARARQGRQYRRQGKENRTWVFSRLIQDPDDAPAPRQLSIGMVWRPHKEKIRNSGERGTFSTLRRKRRLSPPSYMFDQSSHLWRHVAALREIKKETGERRQEILQQRNEFTGFHERAEGFFRCEGDPGPAEG